MTPGLSYITGRERESKAMILNGMEKKKKKLFETGSGR